MGAVTGQIGFNTYQKVEGQKQVLQVNQGSNRFNTYQKVEGQKPSVSNIRTIGNDSG